MCLFFARDRYRLGRGVKLLQVRHSQLNARSLPASLAGGVLIAALLISGSAPAQSSEIPFVDSHSTDTFKISSGSYFSASSGKEKQSNATREVSSPFSGLLDDIAQSFEIIDQHHAGTAPRPSEHAAASSLRSMLRSLDPHSSFYDRAQFASLMGEHRSEYFGTGLTISTFRVNGRQETFVLYTNPGSAAERAGLNFGDRIISVNGEPVQGLDSLRVREMIRGPRGTEASITIERADTLAKRTVSLKRDRLPQKTVPYAFTLYNGIGYIDMTVGFSYTTVTELDKALNDLKLRGMRSLILDLRGNSGGIVDQAITVAVRFLPAGTEILTQKGRSARDDRVWRSQNPTPVSMPLVLLVDGSTASAAEILAGAFQDNDRALIIGERTFGKGLVQNVIDLPDGSGLTLTAARYFTPSGRSIQRNYSDIGLYDYFTKTDKAALIADSKDVRLTITNRKVFGGNGIEPDVAAQQTEISENMVPIVDLAFLFARELAYGRVSGVPGPGQLRQRTIFGDDPVDQELMEMFSGFVRQRPGSLLSGNENMALDIARNQLRYYLIMALFGNDAAAKSLAQNDPQVRSAVSNVDAAARLAADAQRTRIQQAAKKGPLPGQRGGPK